MPVRRTQRATASPRSRRRRRENVLDVGIRSDVASRRRSRRLGRMMRRLFVGCTVAGALWWGGRFTLRRGFLENPEYAVREIRIHGATRMTRDEVLKVAGIREGCNIFKVNLEEIRTNLTRISEVEDARVERSLPGRISIAVRLRQAVAAVAAAGAPAGPIPPKDIWFVDAGGALFDGAGRPARTTPLPLIYGCPERPLRSGTRFGSPESMAALELLDAIERGPLSARFRPRWIDVAKQFCMELMDSSGRKFVFEVGPVAPQLDRLSALLSHCEMNGLEIEEANLMVARNLPVRLRNPGGMLIPLPEPLHPPPPSKQARDDRPQERDAAPRKAAPARRSTPESAIRWMNVGSSKVEVRRATPVKGARGRR